MAGFGEKLRNTREKKGISLELIEEETKIRKMYLEALEEEAFTMLPPRVYAVGFVKRYAHFLGLDVEELTREFKELAYGAGEEEEQQVFRQSTKRSPMLNRIPVKNLFLAAAFLLVAIWAGSILIDYIGNGMNKHEISKTPQINEKKNNPPQKTPAKTPPISKTLDMVVKVKSGQKCWVLVRVDGEEKLQGILNSDQQQSFSAQDTIYIKVGNAAAIDIIVNNKKQEPLGGQGDVMEKEYKYGGKY